MAWPISGVSWRVRSWLELVRAPKQSLARLKLRAPRNLLVVCHGNIYRSPVVAEYLKSHLSHFYSIRSAGFHPVPDRMSPRRYRVLAMSKGIDLASHRSTVIQKVDLDWADVVVLMDAPNWVRLRRMGADPGTLVWLGAFGRGPVGIEDPYGKSERTASIILDQLVQCSERLSLHLKATPIL